LAFIAGGDVLSGRIPVGFGLNDVDFTDSEIDFICRMEVDIFCVEVGFRDEIVRPLRAVA
jgi:hypothetical protein